MANPEEIEARLWKEAATDTIADLRRQLEEARAENERLTRDIKQVVIDEAQDWLELLGPRLKHDSQ